MNAPQNADAERSLLCEMMQSPAAADIGTRLVESEAFYNPMHGDIHRAIKAQLQAQQPVEPMLVVQRLAAMGSRAGELVPEIYTVGGFPGSMSSYAGLVNDAARRRQAIVIAERIIQQASSPLEPGDSDSPLEFFAQQASALGELIDGTDDGSVVPGLVTMDEFSNRPEDPASWVVPGLIERGDVVMLLAGEGLGKSVLSRMMCIAIAAGIHPFKPNVRITPGRTLLVDLENAPGTVARDARVQMDHVGHLTSGDLDTDNAWLWHYPRGLNLRKAKDARLLERVVARVQPSFIAFGSLYKAYQQGGDSYESAAQEVREVLDRIRDRYQVAWWIEHHMPKGDGRERPRTPYGASEWMKWAGYGRILELVGDNTYELRQFRGDRESGREWPAGLSRGGQLRWSAIWDQQEIDYEVAQAKLKAKRG